MEQGAGCPPRQHFPDFATHVTSSIHNLATSPFPPHKKLRKKSKKKNAWALAILKDTPMEEKNNNTSNSDNNKNSLYITIIMRKQNDGKERIRN